MTSFDYGILILRVVTGGTMLMHAWNHWFGGGKIAGTARWFESLGLRPGIRHAWSSVFFEVAAGAGLCLGLFTTLACAAVIGTMSVAGFVAHRPNGFFVFRDGYEYVLVLAADALALAIVGPGAISLDHAFSISIRGGFGAAIALVAGLGGTAALLLTSWQPASRSTSPNV
jgi:putative oxidoreductase